jgi:hypothetical protein
MQLDEEESRRIDEEEEHQRKWANASAEECACLVEEAGGNAEDIGAATNPIYIPDSQESVPTGPTNNTIHDGRRPIDGLTWQQVPSRRNRQTTPSNWSASAQDNLLKALPVDAPARANPPKAPKALPTIGGDTYTNCAGRNPAQRNCTPTQTPAPTTTPSPAPSTLSAGILNSRGTTKNDIIQSAKEVFGANLSNRQSKGQLVLAYNNLLTARGIPTQQTALNATQCPNRPTYQNRATTEWNVRRRLGTAAIEFHKPFNGDAYHLIQAIETRVRQQLGEASPEITILAGQWWSPLSSNFTLTFAG